MKKFLSLALVAVLCLCSLAIPAVAENDVVEVLYLSSTILETPEGAFEQQLIDKFNAENPGIHVTVEGCAANDLNAKLTAMAAARPATEEELLALPGIGEKKLATYGKAFLEEIASVPEATEVE